MDITLFIRLSIKESLPITNVLNVITSVIDTKLSSEITNVYRVGPGLYKHQFHYPPYRDYKILLPIHTGVAGNW